MNQFAVETDHRSLARLRRIEKSCAEDFSTLLITIERPIENIALGAVSIVPQRMNVKYDINLNTTRV